VLAQNFTVNSFIEWSDHAPISFCIPIYCHINSVNVDHSKTSIRWNNDLNDTFRRNIIAKLPVFNTITNNVVFDSRKDVSDCICKFTDVINSVAEPLFSSPEHKVLMVELL